jgi:cytochrome c peroxidase
MLRLSKTSFVAAVFALPVALVVVARAVVATALLAAAVMASAFVVTAQNTGAQQAVPLPEAAASPPAHRAEIEEAALGKLLFFDPRLSGGNQMSCATCHIPEKFFADGLPKGRGAGGRELPRNTQSVLNVALYESYFWDGRAASLEEQALTPIQSPDEMNQNLDALEAELNSVPEYAAAFQSVFRAPAHRDGIAKALAAFQRTLVTRNSAFDRYRAGDESALSQDAREGWEVFQSAGCARCHSGPNFSDNRFYRLGTSFLDKGRGAITGDEQDLFTFRTPGLRDVANTAPYMHDGSLARLADVVEFYYRSTSMTAPGGLRLSFEPLNYRSFSEIPLVVAFLESLSGEPPDPTPPDLPAPAPPEVPAPAPPELKRGVAHTTAPLR